uniref:Putative ovule protein n=1 Tax=Solanum chacoense TaxID=4108 RepID=A0A0V0HM86_SOLCH
MDLIDKAKNFVSEKIANMEKPEATITDVDLKGIGFDGVAFHAKVAVKNPYSVPIPIMEIDYVLKSATRFHFLLLSTINIRIVSTMNFSLAIVFQILKCYFIL